MVTHIESLWKSAENRFEEASNIQRFSHLDTNGIGHGGVWALSSSARFNLLRAWSDSNPGCGTRAIGTKSLNQWACRTNGFSE